MQPETQKNSVDLLGFVDFTEHARFRPAQVICANFVGFVVLKQIMRSTYPVLIRACYARTKLPILSGPFRPAHVQVIGPILLQCY